MFATPIFLSKEHHDETVANRTNSSSTAGGIDCDRVVADLSIAQHDYQHVPVDVRTNQGWVSCCE